MSVMVTGGLGFVGRYIVKMLAEQGEQVISYNRDFSDVSEPNITCVQGELFDIPRLIETINKYSVRSIIHTAGMSHPTLSIDLPITTVNANILGSIHLFEAAKLASVERIVNFSSECVYGTHEEPIDELTPLKPRNPYGVTKVSVEQFSEVYNNLYGMSIISLRVSEVYGPGNKMPQIIYDILRSAIDNTPFILSKGGEQKSQFVYVKDVAKAAINAINCEKPSSHVYNITGGQQVTILEASEIIKSTFPSAKISIGDGIMDCEQQGSYDISLAKRDLNYEPEWSLKKGIQEYSNWLNDNKY